MVPLSRMKTWLTITQKCIVVFSMALIILGVVLRFWHLGSQSYWFDEAFTVEQAKAPLSNLLLGKTHDEGVPALYSVILHGWISLFGESEVSTRSLSGIISCLSILIFYKLSRKITSKKWLALLISAIFSISWLHIWAAREARYYSLLLLCSTASISYYLDVVENEKKIIQFFIFSLAGLFSSYVYIFLLIAEFVTYLLVVRKRVSRFPIIVMGFLLLVFGAQMYFHINFTKFNMSHISLISLKEMLHYSFWQTEESPINPVLLLSAAFNTKMWGVLILSACLILLMLTQIIKKRLQTKDVVLWLITTIILTTTTMTPLRKIVSKTYYYYFWTPALFASIISMLEKRFNILLLFQIIIRESKRQNINLLLSIYQKLINPASHNIVPRNMNLQLIITCGSCVTI
jgi:uncharacterized membrane protein